MPEYRWPGVARRARQRDAWRSELLGRLVNQVLPAEPFQFESALSFLQEEKPFAWGAAGPIRVDLFYHTLPLAIDVVGLEASASWREARSYQSRAAWERTLTRISLKRSRLERYQCPYLILTPDDPTDTASLRARVQDWLGRNL